MIKKIKASFSEKILFLFLLLLTVFTFSFFYVIKNKCFLINPNKLNEIKLQNYENIVVLNLTCGNVFIKLYPDISPNSVERFKILIKNNEYDNIAFHRVIKNTLVQAGDLQFGEKNNLNYGKIGEGKSGYNRLKSELSDNFIFQKGSVGLARTFKKNTEDSQFFIVLKDMPLYQGEYTPIGKVLYGLDILSSVKYQDNSEYVLRPDFINSFRFFKDIK